MKIRKSLLIIGILACFFGTTLGAQVIDNGLGRSLRREFPELAKGYLDLNGNGELDQLSDMDERIPESRVQDGMLQVKEILDFVGTNYPFLSLDRLMKIKTLVVEADGAIPELIALDYERFLDDLIEKKKELDARGLYLTPSARQRAFEQMREYITLMSEAYNKEERALETSYLDARDKLFRMIEQGYPLPDRLADDQRNLLVSAMINTTIKSADQDPKLVKSAIKTLGRLRAERSLPYLTPLMDRDEYRLEVLNAMGWIGSKEAQTILMDQIDEPVNLETRNTAIRALGLVGGEEAPKRLLTLADEDGLDPTTYKTTLKALSLLETDPRTQRLISARFQPLLKDDSPEIRKIAVEGLAIKNNKPNSQALVQLLQKERDPRVQTAVIKKLTEAQDPGAVTALLMLLKQTTLSDSVRTEAVKALGDLPGGIKALSTVLAHLNDPAPEVRAAAEEAVRTLHKTGEKIVASALGRFTLEATEEGLQVRCSSLLAEMADPAIQQVLLTLATSPYGEVRKNATWALYKLGTVTNPKVTTEMKKLVTSEAEPIEVRINAARTLGAAGGSQTTAKPWLPLIQTVKLRGDAYVMLRYYALGSLGHLPAGADDSLPVLLKIARREKNPILKEAALSSIRSLGAGSPETIEGLKAVFKSAEDPDIRIQILETLGDLKTPDTATMTRELLNQLEEPGKKEKILYAASRSGNPEIYDIMVPLLSDLTLSTFVSGLLLDGDPGVTLPLLETSLRSEKDEELAAQIEDLIAELKNRI